MAHDFSTRYYDAVPSNKSELILICANNFINQLNVKYPDRRQLALVLENEYGRQKCVCTTIKPHRLAFPDLIDITSYSQFVANHITYTELEDPTLVPKKLVSPAKVLETQTAHCFELSVLLVSFLIGCGHNAFVVQGYASEDACSNNGLRKIKLDLPEKHVSDLDSENEEFTKESDGTYAVEPEFDLCGGFEKFFMEREKNKTNLENPVDDELFSELEKFLMEDEKNKTELVANPVDEDKTKNKLDQNFDPLYGKRVHCWVMIIPLETDDDPFFIEPSTGEKKEVSDENYIGIEAMWNEKNYWVNSQPLNEGCTQYNFTLTDVNCWEHLLPATLQHEDISQLNLTEIKSFRCVNMPVTWVNILEVSRHKYLKLYPDGKKILKYQNAIREVYSDGPHGLEMQTTYFKSPNYTETITVEKIYKGRSDHIKRIVITHTGKKIETIEHFSLYREDSMKTHTFLGDRNSMKSKRVITFYKSRPDRIVEIEIGKNEFSAMYNDRSDFLFRRWWKYTRTHDDSKLSWNNKENLLPKLISEKYLRNHSKDKDRDIAKITFDLSSNVIEVDYQYGEDQITHSRRQFAMPTQTEIKKIQDTSLMMLEERIVFPYTGHLKKYEIGPVWRQLMQDKERVIPEVLELEREIMRMLRALFREHSF